MKSQHEHRNVALIGLGNIGFRHLQGLARIAPRIRVTAVDPSLSARERASSAWRNSVGTELDVASDLDALPRHTTVVILATSAVGRLDILHRVFAQTSPEWVVLEKVVFQRLADFDLADVAARQAGSRLIVNCPRRMWPLYQAIKGLKFGEAADLQVEMDWRNFGLACNSVHFIDALQFLTGCQEAQLEAATLGEIFPAKREGYIEVFGTLLVGVAGGRRLRIRVLDDGPESMNAALIAGGTRYALVENEGRLYSPTGEPLFDVGRPPFQSELTGDLVAALLDGTRPELATLDESRLAHAALFDALGPHLRSQGIDITRGVPIT